MKGPKLCFIWGYSMNMDLELKKVLKRPSTILYNRLASNMEQPKINSVIVILVAMESNKTGNWQLDSTWRQLKKGTQMLWSI